MIKKTERDRQTERERERGRERNPNLLSQSLLKSYHVRMTSNYCSFVGITVVLDIKTKSVL